MVPRTGMPGARSGVRSQEAENKRRALAIVGGLGPRYRPWLRERTVALLSEPLGDALDGALFPTGFREPFYV